MNAEDEEQRERREAYDRWLQSTGVSVASDLVETTRRDTVSGWGCVARGDIEEGAVLFSIPRGACFGCTGADGGEGGAAGDDDDNDGDDDDDDNDPTTRDTQMEMATSLIKCNTTDERGIGGGSDGGDVEGGGYWKPFTNMLTYPIHGLPWTWPESYRRSVLSGTELQDVVDEAEEQVAFFNKKMAWAKGKLKEAKQVRGYLKTSRASPEASWPSTRRAPSVSTVWAGTTTSR